MSTAQNRHDERSAVMSISTWKSWPHSLHRKRMSLQRSSVTAGSQHTGQHHLSGLSYVGTDRHHDVKHSSIPSPISRGPNTSPNSTAVNGTSPCLQRLMVTQRSLRLCRSADLYGRAMLDFLAQLLGVLICLMVLGILLSGLSWMVYMTLNERDEYLAAKRKRAEDERRRADRKG